MVSDGSSSRALAVNAREVAGEEESYGFLSGAASKMP
jgi:hypothetical protein